MTDEERDELATEAARMTDCELLAEINAAEAEWNRLREGRALTEDFKDAVKRAAPAIEPDGWTVEFGSGVGRVWFKVGRAACPELKVSLAFFCETESSLFRDYEIIRAKSGGQPSAFRGSISEISDLSKYAEPRAGAELSRFLAFAAAAPRVGKDETLSAAIGKYESEKYGFRERLVVLKSEKDARDREKRKEAKERQRKEQKTEKEKLKAEKRDALVRKLVSLGPSATVSVVDARRTGYEDEPKFVWHGRTVCVKNKDKERASPGGWQTVLAGQLKRENGRDWLFPEQGRK